MLLPSAKKSQSTLTSKYTTLNRSLHKPPSTKQYNETLLDLLFNVLFPSLIMEEQEMDKWYSENKRGFIYYYSTVEQKCDNSQKGQTGGGFLSSLRKRRNYIVPIQQNESTPVGPFRVLTPPPEEVVVTLPNDIIETIVARSLAGTNTMGLNNDISRVTVEDVHKVLADTLNSLSASKMLRRVMFDQLKQIKKEQEKLQKTKEDQKIFLQNLNDNIRAALSEVQFAINSYDTEKGSRMKCVTKKFHKFLVEINLSEMANNLISDIFGSLKEWNFDSYVVLIENAARERARTCPDCNQPNNATIMLPYGNFYNSIIDILDCMFHIMLSIPSQQSSCKLTFATDDVQMSIIFNYTEIRLVVSNDPSKSRTISYEYYINPEQETQVKNQVRCMFKNMIKDVSYCKFVDLTVSINGIEKIIADFETILYTNPFSYFINKGSQNLSSNKQWMMYTPLRYLIGKFSKELYEESYNSHLNDSKKITDLLKKVNEALSEIKNVKTPGATSGGKNIKIKYK